MKYLRLFENFNIDANDSTYMNCESYCNKMVGDFKTFRKISDKELRIGKIMPLSKLEEVKSVLKKDDVIAFGDPRLPRHYALYVGDGNVYEVEQWGAKPRIYTLEQNIKMYESIAAVYRK